MATFILVTISTVIYWRKLKATRILSTRLGYKIPQRHLCWLEGLVDSEGKIETVFAIWIYTYKFEFYFHLYILISWNYRSVLHLGLRHERLEIAVSPRAPRRQFMFLSVFLWVLSFTLHSLYNDLLNSHLKGNPRAVGFSVSVLSCRLDWKRKLNI